MDTNNEVPRVKADDPLTNPLEGVVRWSPVKSLWLTSHMLVAVIGGLITLSPENVAVFLFCTAATLCLGHSLGMHRRLIHNSYEPRLSIRLFCAVLSVIQSRISNEYH